MFPQFELSCQVIAASLLGPPARRSGSELIYHCPNHDDRHPSLTINPAKDLFLCAPCRAEGRDAAGGSWKFAAFLSSIDPNDKAALIEWLGHRGLLNHRHADGHACSPSPARNIGQEEALRQAQETSGAASKPEAIYDYTDEQGNLRYQVVRFLEKQFRQRRPAGPDRWIWNLDGVRPLLYRLPELLKAERVLVAEGEKDVLTLKLLGFTATTNSGGAGKWQLEFAEYFVGKDVVIFPDNDEPGRKHAEQVARSLWGKARSLKVVPLPGLEEHGDVSDFVARLGTEAKKLLLAATADSPEWKPPSEQSAASATKLSAGRGGASSAVGTADQCPVLPEFVWYGLSREFREIVGPMTEASPNYHLASFCLAVGASLGRSVYVDRAGRQYPNLFTVLVGKSGGARKSTALRFAIDLARTLDDSLGVVSSIDSREGFIQYLEEIGKKQKQASDLRAIIRLSELRSLIDKSRMEGLRNIVPTLADAYDCPASLEVVTRKSPVSVAYPTISLHAATTPQWIEGLRPEDLQGGLGNRVMWVPGEPGAMLPNPPPRDQARWDALVAKLREQVQFWRGRGSTQFQLSAEAEKRWEKIYAYLYPRGDDDPLIAVLSERLQNHCLKVALIHGALDGSDRIDVRHLEAAYAFAQFLYDALWYLFRGFGASPMAQLDQKIIEAVRQAGPRGIRQRELKKKFWRTDAEMFGKRLYYLTVTDGQLVSVKDGHKVILRLPDPEENP